MNKAPAHSPFPLAAGLMLTVALNACNFNTQKVNTDNDAATTVTAADLNYANINTKVIGPYCLSCHSSAGGNRDGVNLESYATVMSQIELVHATTIIERSMPPSGSSQLSTGAYALLKAWIEAGAPQ